MVTHSLRRYELLVGSISQVTNVSRIKTTDDFHLSVHTMRSRQ